MKPSRSLLIALFALTAAGSAHAVSLQNKDSKSYDIRVTGSSTMSTSIGSGVIKNSVCSSSCKIEVKGVGTIEASGSDRIVIKNGSLKKN